MRKIELLAPAKNLECGIAAIDHGADAVYIGAERFGARAAAGNSIESIGELCRYAHQFQAKVYVTLNTILYDDEIDDTRLLLSQLKTIGVDALLVQDMGLLSLSQHDFVLHASTQTDNRSVDKVKWLKSLGFNRVVLARELSIEDIRAIHRSVPDIELEVFVHGALCVSYSGVCYASQYCFKRSANRGECAQFCRMKFDLEDAQGRLIEHNRYLLSLKDMCRINVLEELLEAGVVSLKIEGRLKDVDYVKNVTAAYSKKLDEIIKKTPGKYQRSSVGKCSYTFTPNLKKTFNRGFTNYFLHGRVPDVFSPDTPKALGEFVGKVKEIRGNSFTVAGTASFANGDGLCFFTKDYDEPSSRYNSKEIEKSGGALVLEGFRVNKAVDNRLFPFKMPTYLKVGMALYRNNDQEFERLMAGTTAERKVPIDITLRETEIGFELSSGSAVVEMPIEKTIAQNPPKENIVRQLSKLGGTPYECFSVHFSPDDFKFFIPSSKLVEMRRQLIGKLILKSSEQTSSSTEGQYDCSKEPHQLKQDELAYVSQGEEYTRYPYLYNISNVLSRSFYEQRGMIKPVMAFETNDTFTMKDEPLLMQCKHCLRFSLGYCLKNGGVTSPWKEPLYLRLADGRRFRLEFNCGECQMNVYGTRR